MRLNAIEEEILLVMEAGRFPLARFELHSSREESFWSIALNYVSMENPTDPMEVVKARAEAIQGLMERGFVFIDYTVNIWVAGDFDIFYHSDIYALLCSTAMEASQKNPDMVFDLPHLRKGYASLTENGLRQVRLLKTGK